LTKNRARALSEALDDCGRGGGGPVFDEADPSDSVMNGIDREARRARSDILTVFAYVVGKVTDVNCAYRDESKSIIQDANTLIHTQ